jgi:hypothetical protein
MLAKRVAVIIFAVAIMAPYRNADTFDTSTGRLKFVPPVKSRFCQNAPAKRFGRLRAQNSPRATPLTPCPSSVYLRHTAKFSLLYERIYARRCIAYRVARQEGEECSRHQCWRTGQCYVRVERVQLIKRSARCRVIGSVKIAKVTKIQSCRKSLC